MGFKSPSVTTYYHFAWSLAEVQVWEKSTIIFELRLGNIFFIGDGLTNQTKVPNAWLKKFPLQRGSGYIKIYPESITLYKNSLSNPLTEGEDFEYDPTTGTITFFNVPQQGDLIAGTWTYDSENPEETTVYADFSTAELVRKLGFKLYKYEDEGLDTYEKVLKRGQELLEELYKAVFPGNFRILWNPRIKRGQSILVKDSRTGDQKVYMVRSVSENHSINEHSIEIEGLAFVEDELAIKESILRSYNKFELLVPQLQFIAVDNPYWINPGGGNYNDYNDDRFTPRADRVIIGSKIFTVGQEIDRFFRGNIEVLYGIRNQTIKTYPTTEQNKPFVVQNGVACQQFDLSPTTGEMGSELPEFINNPDLFFSIKNVRFTIRDANNPTLFQTKELQYVYMREAISPFLVAPFDGNTHFVFLDWEGNLWITDGRFNHQKIGQGSLTPGRIYYSYTSQADHIRWEYNKVVVLYTAGSNILAGVVVWDKHAVLKLYRWDFNTNDWVYDSECSIFVLPRPFTKHSIYRDSNGYYLIGWEGSNASWRLNVLKWKPGSVILSGIDAYGGASSVKWAEIFDNKVFASQGVFDFDLNLIEQPPFYSSRAGEPPDYRGAVVWLKDVTERWIYAITLTPDGRRKTQRKLEVWVRPKDGISLNSFPSSFIATSGNWGLLFRKTINRKDDYTINELLPLFANNLGQPFFALVEKSVEWFLGDTDHNVAICTIRNNKLYVLFKYNDTDAFLGSSYSATEPFFGTTYTDKGDLNYPFPYYFCSRYLWHWGDYSNVFHNYDGSWYMQVVESD